MQTSSFPKQVCPLLIINLRSLSLSLLKVRELAINLHRILLDTVKMQSFQNVRPPITLTQCTLPSLVFIGSRNVNGPNVQNI